MTEEKITTVELLLSTAKKVVLEAMIKETEEIKLPINVQAAIEILKIYKSAEKTIGNQFVEQLEKRLKDE